MFRKSILLFCFVLPTVVYGQLDSLPSLTQDSLSVTINFGPSKVVLFNKVADQMEWAKLIQRDTLFINFFRRSSNTGECEIRIVEISKISSTGFDFSLIFRQIYPPHAKRPILMGHGYSHYFIGLDFNGLKEATRIVGVKFRFGEM